MGRFLPPPLFELTLSHHQVSDKAGLPSQKPPFVDSCCLMNGSENGSLQCAWVIAVDQWKPPPNSPAAGRVCTVQWTYSVLPAPPWPTSCSQVSAWSRLAGHRWLPRCPLKSTFLSACPVHVQRMFSAGPGQAHYGKGRLELYLQVTPDLFSLFAVSPCPDIFSSISQSLDTARPATPFKSFVSTNREPPSLFVPPSSLFSFDSSFYSLQSSSIPIPPRRLSPPLTLVLRLSQCNYYYYSVHGFELIHPHPSEPTVQPDLDTTASFIVFLLLRISWSDATSTLVHLSSPTPAPLRSCILQRCLLQRFHTHHAPRRLPVGVAIVGHGGYQTRISKVPPGRRSGLLCSGRCRSIQSQAYLQQQWRLRQ